jgi:RNA polymerase sigma-70 factor (ECF subfamily)
MRDTEDAVRGILAGDERAFTLLVRLWENKVYSLAWRFLGNREDAQDVVQETFLSVFKSLHTLREPKSFSTWLYRIALNHCRAHWRSQSHHISLDEPAGDERGEENWSPAPALSVPAEAGRVETLDLVRKAMADLSDDHRMAIILKEYLGLNLEEVAQVMECPLSTAKSRLYHGLRNVQRKLRSIQNRTGSD